MLDHVTIRVSDVAASERFYATALGRTPVGSEYREWDERPEYHAGYVGAFVLDPDGNNVEAVNRNR